jgi:hypothetical protein
VADACRTGAATDIIFGMALGYKSAIIPCIIIAMAIFVSFSLAHMYGIACAALGMLATIATCLAIDAYGPISDNAGGIAEMAAMGEDIRERTDALDAAGNTTAAIGKGFAIGSGEQAAQHGGVGARCGAGAGQGMWRVFGCGFGASRGLMFKGRGLPAWCRCRWLLAAGGGFCWLKHGEQLLCSGLAELTHPRMASNLAGARQDSKPGLGWPGVTAAH